MPPTGHTIAWSVLRTERIGSDLVGRMRVEHRGQARDVRLRRSLRRSRRPGRCPTAAARPRVLDLHGQHGAALRLSGRVDHARQRSDDRRGRRGRRGLGRAWSSTNRRRRCRRRPPPHAARASAVAVRSAQQAAKRERLRNIGEILGTCVGATSLRAPRCGRRAEGGWRRGGSCACRPSCSPCRGVPRSRGAQSPSTRCG